ncbi:benzoate 4-monooxygenase cytochrome P450 protein [Rutstroemia sp. NJR-2017a BBW]|nr:benzoate 4-monooxygenase cytochrome P450 protein [Rutstroemia sp. NJR-2017a BBW]
MPRLLSKEQQQGLGIGTKMKVYKTCSGTAFRRSSTVTLEFGFGQSFELQKSSKNDFLIQAVEATSLKAGVIVQYPNLANLKPEKILARRTAKMRERYLELMAGLVRDRLASEKSSHHDLFSFVVDAKDPETGKGFSESELWAESRFLLIAGYSTLWREVSAADGVWIDGVHVPKGVDIGVLPYAFHHNEQISPNAYAFIPERWIESPDSSRGAIENARAAFSPFSIGTRSCAGKTLAYTEISGTIARTLWSLDMKRAEGPLGEVSGGIEGAGEGYDRGEEFQLEDHITCSLQLSTICTFTH